MANKNEGLTVVDDPTVKEIYANKFICSMFDGGSVTITMGVMRFMPEKTEGGPKKGDRPQVNTTVRIALSPAGAVELINNLGKMLNTLQAAASRAPDQKLN